MSSVSFEIHKKSGALARAGVLKTAHGDIKTPAFITVGTKATIKGIAPDKFAELGIQGLIANTYHLFLSPGEELIKNAGGIHRFMGWNGPIMTDSGGFQVFSLGEGFGKSVSKFTNAAEVAASERARTGRSSEAATSAATVWSEEFATQHGKLAIVDEDGVTFTSHLDGSLHRFTPERSIEIQHALGADIIFAFDECTSAEADHAYQKEAMDRTHHWAKRSLAAHRQSSTRVSEYVQGAGNSTTALPALYGIVQGGRFADLRVESAKFLANMDFDGYGIGGSYTKEDLVGLLELVNTELPEGKPRHLLGIGEPEDLFLGAAAGIDTFDCVVPTRRGRTGSVYTHEGLRIIRNAEYKNDFAPIDSTCDCFVCKQFTRSYIHHLFRSDEMLGQVLATAHNIRFLTKLAEDIRTAIMEDRFNIFRENFLAAYAHR